MDQQFGIVCEMISGTIGLMERRIQLITLGTSAVVAFVETIVIPL
jgi:hypothetical protein